MNRIEQLLKFIKEDAADTFSRYALGLEYAKLGNHNEALRCFDYLFTHYPEYTGTYFQYAELLRHVGRTKEAIQVYKKGMEVTHLRDLKTYSELQNALANLEMDI